MGIQPHCLYLDIGYQYHVWSLGKEYLDSKHLFEGAFRNCFLDTEVSLGRIYSYVQAAHALHNPLRQ